VIGRLAHQLHVDCRLRLDAAARHIQDVGQDHVHELGFDESHPLWWCAAPSLT